MNNVKMLQAWATATEMVSLNGFSYEKAIKVTAYMKGFNAQEKQHFTNWMMDKLGVGNE